MLAKEKDLAIISDEVYEDFVYSGTQVPSIATLNDDAKNRTIVINSVSKTFAMTGWRIGYLACDVALAKTITNWQSHSTSNPNSIAQAAAAAALTGSWDCVERMVAAFDTRRQRMVDMLNRMPGVHCPTPPGAFYCLPDLSELMGKSYHGRRIENDEDFATVLLEEKAVAVVPGGGFGAKNHVRLSYALDLKSLEKGLSRMAEFVSELS